MITLNHMKIWISLNKRNETSRYPAVNKLHCIRLHQRMSPRKSPLSHCHEIRLLCHVCGIHFVSHGFWIHQLEELSLFNPSFALNFSQFNSCHRFLWLWNFLCQLFANLFENPAQILVLAVWEMYVFKVLCRK